MAKAFEIVLVDDGSSDRTFHMLREIAAVDSRVTVVRLRRNFGQTSPWRPASIMLAANTSSPWMATCSTIPPTFRCSWKRSPKATTSSADGAKTASTISGCAAFLPLRQLADGEVQRRGYPRLRHDIQSLSPRHSGAGSALRRVAPLHSGAGLVARRVHLRSAHLAMSTVSAGFRTTASRERSAYFSI